MEWITCESIYDESWRILLEYANIELAVEAIESIHGKSTPKTKANYKKQAEQARASLLQAKEYFEASRSSSLFTQPNHLYYGAVALSTACMLIRGTGEKSLDYLRKDPKNAHHGLEFTFSANTKAVKQGTKLFENSYIKICPNGHFLNWYSTLMTKQMTPALNTLFGQGTAYRRLELIGSSNILGLDKLINRKRSLEYLIKRLPDLYADLLRYDIQIKAARGEHKVSTNVDNDKTEHFFTFHSSPSHETLIEIIQEFQCEDAAYFDIKIDNRTNSGVVKTRNDIKRIFDYPDSRETLDNKVIFYKDIMDIPEVADMFLISYALSILSRYYPDVWVSFLESHCKGAKLIERIVRVITLKLPVLMLNQLSGRLYIISNHRPFWY